MRSHGCTCIRFLDPPTEALTDRSLPPVTQMKDSHEVMLPPYQKTGICDIFCPEVITATFDFAVNANNKISEMYEQKFHSCLRVEGKEQLSLILPQLERYRDIKCIYLLCHCSSEFPPFHI